MSKGSNRGESFCSRAVIAKVVPTSNPTSSLAQHLTIAAYNLHNGKGVVPPTKIRSPKPHILGPRGLIVKYPKKLKFTSIWTKNSVTE